MKFCGNKIALNSHIYIISCKTIEIIKKKKTLLCMCVGIIRIRLAALIYKRRKREGDFEKKMGRLSHKDNKHCENSAPQFIFLPLQIQLNLNQAPLLFNLCRTGFDRQPLPISSHIFFLFYKHK